MSHEKIQKRLVTFEIITKGEKPVDLDIVARDALTAGFHNLVARAVNLRYVSENDALRQHEFVGVDIKEIK